MFQVDGYIKKEKKRGTHLFVHLNVEAVGHFVILKNVTKVSQIKQFKPNKLPTEYPVTWKQCQIS